MVRVRCQGHFDSPPYSYFPLATYTGPRALIPVAMPELPDASLEACGLQMNVRRRDGKLAWRTSGGRLHPEPMRSCAARLIVFGPCWWSDRMVLLSRRFKMSLFFNTSLSYGRQTGCSATRLPLPCSRETVTSRGPATSLAAWVLGPARRCECSPAARTAYGTCANDLRSRATRLRNGDIPGGGKGLKPYLGWFGCDAHARGDPQEPPCRQRRVT